MREVRKNFICPETQESCEQGTCPFPKTGKCVVQENSQTKDLKEFAKEQRISLGRPTADDLGL
jgi:hypothetical protein